METGTPPIQESSSAFSTPTATRVSTRSQSLSSRRRVNIHPPTDSPGSVSSDSSSDDDDQDSINYDGEIDDEFEKVINHFNKLEMQDADGGDSDIEGEEFEIFDAAYAKSVIDRKNNDGEDCIHIKEINNGDIAFVIAEDGVFIEDGNDIDLNNLVHKPPNDWVPPPKKNDTDPDFDSLDNPGNWSNFIYRPVYKKTGKGSLANYKYIRHELPTGCSVVPPNKEGKRLANGWEFFYNGWKSKKKSGARDGATPDNLFPEVRASSLDGEVLTKLGLTRDRVIGPDGMPDALFFFQLLLPMCDTSKSGISNDPRKNFYCDVTRFSNLYKYQNGIGSTYGHHIAEAEMPEYVRWDGCLVRDGVRGGGDGALYRRWNKNTSHSDEYCQEAMSLDRWVNLKRIYKLNNNDVAKNKEEAGYNPAYKYDLIFDVLTSNVRAMAKKAELDLTGDETTWGFQGYGESGEAVVKRVVGKPGVSKGGQTALVSATNRIRPYWYQHRNNRSKKYGDGWKAEGPCEVRSCIDELEKLIVGREGNEKKIFPKEPHITWDNYFSGERVFHYAGEKGFGLTMTCRRDRLPEGVKGEFMHKKKTDHVTDRTKVARFIEPVILVKEKDDYEIVLTSFQSTSSCNIMSINSISENKNFIEARSRGRKKYRRIYAIEHNLSRLIYLKTYSRIDSIDHMIKICAIKYTTWKYWHSPTNHCKSLAICTAYDMYLEICEGAVIPDFKVDSPADFYTFRDILSKQMCEYDPTQQRYPGDEKTRLVKQLNKDMRKRKYHDIIAEGYNGTGTLSYAQYKSILKHSDRICTDLTSYERHVTSIVTYKNPAKCAVCGLKTYKKCELCGVPLHNMDIKGPGKGKNCALHWHNDSYLGLCFDDRKFMRLTSKQWKIWSNSKLQKNIRVIKGYKAK